MTSPLSSQRTERILLQAMEEVLGEQGLRLVFQAAHRLAAQRTGSAEPATEILWPEGQPIPFDTAGLSSTLFLGCLLAAFEEVYGELAGRGLVLRVGRAVFAYGLREYGADLGLTGSGFRLLPFPARLRAFGRALGSLFNEAENQRLEIEEKGGKWLVHLTGCPLCIERQGGEPMCQLAVGLAEESLYWLSGGKIFQVEEIECAARGDADCTLQIDEAPIS